MLIKASAEIERLRLREVALMAHALDLSGKIDRLRADRARLRSRLSSARNHFDEMGAAHGFKMLARDVEEFTA